MDYSFDIDDIMKNVLIVEDEILIAKVYETQIKRKNLANVFLSSTLATAEEIIERENPSLFLLDVNLKNNESGITLAKKIRETSSLPIIFTTGNTNPEVDAELQSISNAQVLIKPINFDELLKVVEDKLQ